MGGSSGTKSLGEALVLADLVGHHMHGNHQIDPGIDTLNDDH